MFKVIARIFTKIENFIFNAPIPEHIQSRVDDYKKINKVDLETR